MSNRANATQLPKGSWIQRRLAGSGVIEKPGIDQSLVIAIAWPEHHPMLAKCDWPPIAVGRDVAYRQDCHGVGLMREWTHIAHTSIAMSPAMFTRPC